MLGLVSNVEAFKAGPLRQAKLAMLDGMGRLVRDEAFRLCRKRTGYTASTIGYTVRTSDDTVQIHCDGPAGFFLEFGTRLMPAHPFLRPALLAARNWSNRGVNTEMQFHAIQPSANPLPMPRANPHAIRHNERINSGLNKKFKGVGSLLHKRPSVVFHGKTGRSQTGRMTHPIHERYGR